MAHYHCSICLAEIDIPVDGSPILHQCSHKTPMCVDKNLEQSVIDDANKNGIPLIWLD